MQVVSIGAFINSERKRKTTRSRKKRETIVLLVNIQPPVSEPMLAFGVTYGVPPLFLKQNVKGFPQILCWLTKKVGVDHPNYLEITLYVVVLDNTKS